MDLKSVSGGEVKHEEQTRLKTELTVVHVYVSGILNGLQMSWWACLQNIMNINSFCLTPEPADICKRKTSLAVTAVRQEKKREF